MGPKPGLHILGKRNNSCSSYKIKNEYSNSFYSCRIDQTKFGSEIQSTLKRFAGGYSEKLVPTYQTKRCQKPEGGNIQIQGDGNPRCHRFQDRFKWRYSVNTVWHENLTALSNTQSKFLGLHKISEVCTEQLKSSKMGSIFPSALAFRTTWQLIRTF
jgi:hypothetical protein